MLSAGVFNQTGAERNLAKAQTSPGSFGTSGARRNCRSVQTLGIFFPPLSRTDEEIKTRVRSGRSEEAVVAGYVGEAAEGVGAAGGQTGAQLRSPAHRVGHHLSGELRIDVLEVSRASLGE